MKPVEHPLKGVYLNAPARQAPPAELAEALGIPVSDALQARQNKSVEAAEERQRNSPGSMGSS